MNKNSRSEILRMLERNFGDRLERRPSVARGPTSTRPLASVVVSDGDEVALLAELTARYSVPLRALGGGTSPGVVPPAGAILVNFERMRRISLPEPGVLKVESGVTWVELEDHLRMHMLSARVYPTSAPRSTVGGWVARDGLGIGSFEFGWFRENVGAVDLVLEGGSRYTVPGGELGTGDLPGIAIETSLEIRDSQRDIPFALSFDAPERLARAVREIHRSDFPLWHLGFMSPDLARAAALRHTFLLFGAYPEGRATDIEADLEPALTRHSGRVLPPAEAHRVWGGRFFPADPSGVAPAPGRIIVHISKLAAALRRLEDTSADLSFGGTVARGGEVMLLAYRTGAREGRPTSLDAGGLETLERAARATGSD